MCKCNKKLIKKNKENYLRNIYTRKHGVYNKRLQVKVNIHKQQNDGWVTESANERGGV